MMLENLRSKRHLDMMCHNIGFSDRILAIAIATSKSIMIAYLVLLRHRLESITHVRPEFKAGPLCSRQLFPLYANPGYAYAYLIALPNL